MTRVWCDGGESARLLGGRAAGNASLSAPHTSLWAALAGPHAGPRPVLDLAADLPFWTFGACVGTAEGSQYDALRDLAWPPSLADANVFALAGSGRGFHGQHGRAWNAVAGNTHLCASFAADLPAADCGPVMPALPALALHDVVAATLPPDRRVDIKWVNDVLIDGVKVAGALTSLRTVEDRIRRVFVGLGLNVLAAPPVQDAAPTTCLAASVAADPARCALDLLGRLQWRWEQLVHDGPAALVEDYRRCCGVVGRRVCLEPPPGGFAVTPRQARVLAIAPDLGLVLDDGGPVATTGRLRYLDT